jgi:hypothetical protein
VGFLRVLFFFYLLATTTTLLLSLQQKPIQVYKLYKKGNKPVEMALELGLSENEATRHYTEYWKLKRLYKLHSICLDHSFKYVDLSRSISAL